MPSPLRPPAVSVHLPFGLRDELQQIAAERLVSLSDVIRTALLATVRERRASEPSPDPPLSHGRGE
jgi:metal-responsive CopG/Arc/MetJ family transcriptional regulator